jgi:hypothetical protein
MAVRSLVLFLLVIAILYWPLSGSRSLRKRALLTLFLAVFFTYGRIYNLVMVRLLGTVIGRHNLVITPRDLAAGVFWICATGLAGVTQALNGAAHRLVLPGRADWRTKSILLNGNLTGEGREVEFLHV